MWCFPGEKRKNGMGWRRGRGVTCKRVDFFFVLLLLSQVHPSTSQQLRYQLISTTRSWSLADSHALQAVHDQSLHKCRYLSVSVQTTLKALAGHDLVPLMTIDTMHLLARVKFPNTESTPLFVRFWQSQWVYTRYD